MKHLIAALLAAVILAPAYAADTAQTRQIPLVIYAGTLAGLGDGLHVLGDDELYDAGWQPAEGVTSQRLRSVHGEYPDGYAADPLGYAHVGGAWEASRVDLSQPGGRRPPTLEELRVADCAAREVRLGDEWRAYLNQHHIGDPQALDCALGMSTPQTCQALTTARTAVRGAYESQSAALLDPTATRAYCTGLVATWPEVQP